MNAARASRKARAPDRLALTRVPARVRVQNLGNFLTDRNSSRVLAPPGGASSIVFGA